MNDLTNLLMDNLVVPVVAALGGLLLLVIKSFGDKITKSTTSKNDAAQVEAMFNIRQMIIKEVQELVDAAVASNMQIADDMKKNGHRLTDEEAKNLSVTAKNLVLVSLPDELVKDDGSLCKIIGGPQKLESMIDAMIEKSVYMYKIQKNSTTIIPGDGQFTGANGDQICIHRGGTVLNEIRTS